MAKRVSINGDGRTYTLNLDQATVDILKATLEFKNNRGEIDINNMNLAVKLTGEGTVGFGPAAPTLADKLFGVILSYSTDQMVAVKKTGGVDSVPASGTFAAGDMGLAVNNKGQVVKVANTPGLSQVVFTNSEDGTVALDLV